MLDGDGESLGVRSPTNTNSQHQSVVTFLHLHFAPLHHPPTLLFMHSNLSKRMLPIAISKCPLHQPAKKCQKSIILGSIIYAYLELGNCTSHQQNVFIFL